MQSRSRLSSSSMVAGAVALAIGSTSAFAAQSIVRGVVGGTFFTAPVFADTAAGSVASANVASVYSNAKVCFDLNDNGVCDSAEPSTVTGLDGSFQLSSKTLAPLVAEIGTDAANNGNPVTSRNVFRVRAEQISAATTSPLLPATVHITPLTTEVARMMEADGLTFAQARTNLASRINVSVASVLLPPTKVTDVTELPAVLKESLIDTGRFELAAKFVDRGDTVGALRGNFDCPNVNTWDVNANSCSASDAATVQIKDAQQWAMKLEGIPRYDYVFVIIMENQSLVNVKNNANIPYMNSFLNTGNQFYNYFSTGNPSEPNYMALGGGDDWGVTGDGSNPISGVRANLFNALSAKGMSYRIYEETMLPGQSITSDNPANSTIKGTTGTGSAGRSLVSGLRALKHNPAIYYLSVRNAPEFAGSSRSLGGGAWDEALQSYANSNNIKSWWTNNTQTWNVDQFSLDLASGDVGNYNFLVPDQCDDMHGIDNCTSSPNSRGDNFFKSTVQKIQASPLWKDPNKRVAIVLTYDEGQSTTVPASCCGWNSGGNSAGPLKQNSDGSYSTTTNGTSATYKSGNKGHGVQMFGLMTNQQDPTIGTAPHGKYDTDYYSHFSFVRTLQDLFGTADPGQPGSYMNRSKYTESFIYSHASLLPEYTGSANPHFDAVRSMNHVYQFPAGVARRIGGGGLSASQLPVSSGPDADQVNTWALK